jgi:hypothetical protein
VKGYIYGPLACYLLCVRTSGAALLRGNLWGCPRGTTCFFIFFLFPTEMNVG